MFRTLFLPFLLYYCRIIINVTHSIIEDVCINLSKRFNLVEEACGACKMSNLNYLNKLINVKCLIKQDCGVY